MERDGTKVSSPLQRDWQEYCRFYCLQVDSLVGGCLSGEVLNFLKYFYEVHVVPSNDGLMNH